MDFAKFVMVSIPKVVYLYMRFLVVGGLHKNISSCLA